MRSWLAAAEEAVRARLWPIPLLAVAVAVVGGVLLPRWDAQVDSAVPGALAFTLFGGDAEAARTLLGAVASSLITVTSLTFSLTVVTLQLASSQFSPRLLRTFTGDVFVQATLGLFLATFTFSLTVLRTVRSQSEGQVLVVPRLSVTLSLVLAVASVMGLVVFLAHLAAQIRVESMLRDVHEQTDATIELVYGESEEGAVDAPKPPPVHRGSGDSCVLFAPSSGFLRPPPSDRLLAMAVELDVVVVIERCTGDHVVAGTPIGVVWRPGGRLQHDEEQRAQHGVDDLVSTGFERSAGGDVTYGLRQLTDVVNKALSPGINDPTTAVHALGHVSAVLCRLAGQALGPVTLCGPDGSPRLVLHRHDLRAIMSLTLTQPRRYGAADPQVMLRLVDLLHELAWHVRRGDEAVVSAELGRLRSAISNADFDAVSAADLEVATERVESALARRAAGTIPGEPVVS